MLRATLKSLLSRKLRLVLSGLAVVLGVMATSGALTLTATLTSGFDELFGDVYTNVDVQVSGPAPMKHVDGAGESVHKPLPPEMVRQVADVPGVRKAYGEIVSQSVRVVGPDGKVIVNQGPPTLGTGWHEHDAMVELRSGHSPKADDQIVVNASLAERGEFTLGERVEVLTSGPKQSFELVGIFGYDGGRDSVGGETSVAFTEQAAQRLLLGKPGYFSNVTVQAEDGVNAAELKTAVAQAIGGDWVVQTGEELAKENAQDVQSFVSVLEQVLLGFAGVALFVGIFLILNTFSILVAQRTGELALLRSLGASRRQVLLSVLIEALVIGFIAATVGLAAGIGVAAGLKSLMLTFTSTDLPGPWLEVPASAVIVAYVVGIVVTVLAAILPALRASKTSPVSAMTAASTQDRPLTRLTIVGGLTTAAGIAIGAVGLFSDGALLALFGGVLLAFVGVAMLTSAICRPVVSVLGKVLSFSTAGKLGKLNSARNPRRTSITAAALMVGIALVTGVSVLAQSLTASLEETVASDLRADLMVSGQLTGPEAVPPTFDPRVLRQAREIDGVESVAALRRDGAELTIGSRTTPELLTAADPAALAEVFGLRAKSGELRTLEPDELVLSEDNAKELRLAVGDKVTVDLQRAKDKELEVVGVYRASVLMGGLIIAEPLGVAGFRADRVNQAFVQLAEGASIAPARKELSALLADNPEVSVQDQQDVLESASNQVETMKVMLYVLLGLALVIAALGIVNTLALSVLERTRELGLLRAIGMRRRQLMQMITVESVVIAVFGALLGVLVGVGLGSAVVYVLREEIAVLAMPWTSLAAFFGAAVLIGLLAAVLPAIRAARTNVLSAIAYE